MKSQTYKRGEYNKTIRRDKRINIIVSEAEYLKVQILAEQLEINYSAIMREGLQLLYDKHKGEFMCEKLYIDYIKTI